MNGVIFIRTLTSDEEMILETFKEQNGIAAKKKAIQGIITKYSSLVKSQKTLEDKLYNRNLEIEKLKSQMKEFKDFFKLMNKLSKSKKIAE